MKTVRQTILNGEYGDCLRACVASVLELKLADVPNFADAPDASWFDLVQDFLARYGFYAVVVDMDNLPNGIAPRGYYLLAGTSPRGFNHAVVAKDGKVVHDPHPKGGGLVTIKQAWLFTSLYPARKRWWRWW